jgi:hypothetical protein
MDSPPKEDLFAGVEVIDASNDETRGTNSNKNVAVISHALNRYLWNNNPPEAEVKRLTQ